MDPLATSSRGRVTLQPAYFMSSLFVEPLRNDINTLLVTFSARYAQHQHQPFVTFKKCWSDQGWKWLHFRTFDGKSRQALLNTVFRLLLESACNPTDPVHGVAALFSLYALYFTQPNSIAPKLHYISYIPIPYDSLLQLKELPKCLTTPYLLPLRGSTAFALSCFLKRDAFHITPSSGTHSIAPFCLPREIVRKIGVSEVPLETKKQGRPSKQDKYRRAKEALSQLDIWVERSSVSSSTSFTGVTINREADTAADILVPRITVERPVESFNQYVSQKLQLLTAIGLPNVPISPESFTRQQKALLYANETSVKRLMEIEQQAALQGKEIGDDDGGSHTGLERAQRAAKEFGGLRKAAGVLSLTEGGGLEMV